MLILVTKITEYPTEYPTKDNDLILVGVILSQYYNATKLTLFYLQTYNSTVISLQFEDRLGSLA